MSEALPADAPPVYATQADLDAVSARVDEVSKRVDEIAAAAPTTAPPPASGADESVAFSAEVEPEDNIVERGGELIRKNADGSEEVVGIASAPAEVAAPLSATTPTEVA